MMGGSSSQETELSQEENQLRVRTDWRDQIKELNSFKGNTENTINLKYIPRVHILFYFDADQTKRLRLKGITVLLC